MASTWLKRAALPVVLTARLGGGPLTVLGLGGPERGADLRVTWLPGYLADGERPDGGPVALVSRQLAAERSWRPDASGIAVVGPSDAVLESPGKGDRW